jgi:peptidoglycan/LPS O-acetylase OafA/YrhL
MAERHEIRGLDTLRFVAASVVALGHGAAFPLTQAVGKGHGWLRAATAIYGVSFDGVAAVVVFFLVSGFCIHYGALRSPPFRAGPFLVRRAIRIAPPVVAAMALAAYFGPTAQAALAAVLWSVWCELIYYGLYPLLRRFGFATAGVANLNILALVIAGAMVVLGWLLPYPWSYGVGLTWLVAAPAWLLGCMLAEQIHAVGPHGGPEHVWAWRIGVWLYSALALAVFFHAPFVIGFPALLFLFQPLAYLWILAEIRHFQQHKPSRLLEWCGRWSFSLYLIHNIAIAETPLAAGDLARSWAMRIAAIVAGSLGFYLLVEAPSHWLARAAARRLTDRQRGRAVIDPGLAAP